MREQHAIDRRVQKTHRLLRDALVTLIHEKGYDSIAVKEILERANVGRSAFYTHFRDKDSLLASGIDHMLHATPARPLPPNVKRFAKVLWFSFPVLKYVRQCAHTTDWNMDSRGRTMVHERLRQVLIERLSDGVRAQILRSGARADAVPPDLLVQYIVGTFILVLNWWVESGSTLSPLEADDMFLSMVLPTLAATVEEDPRPSGR